MITKGLVPALCIVLSTTSFSYSQTATARSSTPSPTKAFHALLDKEWEHGLEESPLFASSLGDKRKNREWGDASLAHLEAEYQRGRGVQKKLAAIERAKLSPSDQISYDLFKRQVDEGLKDYEFGFPFVPVNQREGVQLSGTNSENLTFTTVQDYEDWIARIEAFPKYFEQNADLMREGLKRGIKFGSYFSLLGHPRWSRNA